MRNSRRDSRKGDKMLDKYLGPYEVVEVKNKGLYEIKNLKTGKRLAKMVNVARLKVFKGTNFTSFNILVITEIIHSINYTNKKLLKKSLPLHAGPQNP